MKPGEDWQAGRLLKQTADSPSAELAGNPTLALTATALYVTPGSVDGDSSASLEQAAYRIDDPQVIWAIQIVTDGYTATGVEELYGQFFDIIPSSAGQAMLDTAFSTSSHCRLVSLDADHMTIGGKYPSGTAQWIVNVVFTPTYTKN